MFIHNKILRFFIHRKRWISTRAVRAENPLKFCTKISTAFLLISFFGCRPEVNSLPEISIQQPRANEVFSTGDTLSMHLALSDDKMVTSYHAALLNDKDETVASMSEAVNEMSKEVKVGFPIEPVYLPSGDYVLLVTVFDDEESSVASVAIELRRGVKKLEYFLTLSDGNVSLVDETFFTITSHQFNEPIKSIKSDHRNKSYFVHFESGSLANYDMFSHDLTWRTDDNSDPKRRTVKDFYVGKELSYLLGEDLQLVSVDLYGRQAAKATMGNVGQIYSEYDWHDVLAFTTSIIRLDAEHLGQLSYVSPQIPLEFLCGSNSNTYALTKKDDAIEVHGWETLKREGIVRKTVDVSIDSIKDILGTEQGVAILEGSQFIFVPNDYTKPNHDFELSSPTFLEKEPLNQLILIGHSSGVTVFDPKTQSPIDLITDKALDAMVPVYNY